MTGDVGAVRQRYYFATDNGMLIWDVDSMLKAIENHPGDFELRLVDTDVLARENQDAMVNETYAMETNLEKPCILAEVGKGHYLLLDGNHRLRKAVREKLSCMICYCLKEEQHQKYIENYRQKEYERVMAGY
jgi:parB-like nuclease domain